MVLMVDDVTVVVVDGADGDGDFFKRFSKVLTTRKNKRKM